MKLKLVALGVVLMLVACAPSASASEILLNVDHCTGGCGPMPAGLVTLTQTAVNTVDVDVVLYGDRLFVETGFEGSFGFNLVSRPQITISDLTGGWLSNGTMSAGSYHIDGFGYFDYAVKWGQQGGGKGTSEPLHFTVTAAGLTTDSFEEMSSGGTPVWFAGDVAWPTSATTRNTGAVGGSGVNENVVPEPASLLLLGTGLLGGIFHRRRSR